MAGREPNFSIGDKVGSKSGYDRDIYYVESEPEQTDGTWYMIVNKRKGGSDTVAVCSAFILLEKHVTPEPLIKASVIKEILTKMKPALITGAILVVLALIAASIAGNFNSLVTARAQVDNSWAKVETQYQRRLDLIDNVVGSVKGDQKQEQAVFGQIADARKQYSAAQTTDQKAEAATQVETVVAQLPRLQEAYPELKSDGQISKLITELQGTENTIAGARNGYNDTVTHYNTNISSFPKNLFANLFGFEKAKLFKAADGADKAVKVSF